MPNHPAYLEWQIFENQLEGLRDLCQEPAAASVSPSQYVSLLQDLQQQLHARMTDRSDRLAFPGSTQRHVTELHRLLRLSLTDAALYQGARSTTLQQQRLTQLRDRLALLHQHARAITAILTDED
jgi:hypothetical protein